ncbi:uncharacterized protein LOC113464259 [Ceratina calcarata]|uniref:Uncharacterized protein LOC113464259 n=1 Tax=Ceratina calcarata TaxID=156304 RepID=A0AAJ7S050_9HYME|nr:uncharacterized protein LOC113464259 [Ceratina calcarata]
MNLIAWISVYSIVILEIYCLPIDEGCNCNGAEIVTYGEPCVTLHKYPFQIEGPKVVQAEETVQINVPAPMQFIKIVPNTYVANTYQPRRVEYPMTVETPRVISKSAENIVIENTGHKKVYEYTVQVPSAVNPPPPSRNYNYEIEAPVPTKDVTVECETRETIPQRLTGLESRIDRVLVPACEVPSLSSPCQC